MSAPQQPQTDPHKQEDPAPVFNTAEIKRLENEIGTAGMRRLLEVYQRDLESRMQRIESAFATHDYQALAHECHALRSASMSLGLARFAAELAALETMARKIVTHYSTNQGNEEVAEHRHRLRLILCDSRPFLDTLCAGLQASPAENKALTTHQAAACHPGQCAECIDQHSHSQQ